MADDVLPQTIEVVQTRAKPLGITVKVGKADDATNSDCFGVLLQYPGVTARCAITARSRKSCTPKARA